MRWLGIKHHILKQKKQSELVIIPSKSDEALNTLQNAAKCGKSVILIEDGSNFGLPMLRFIQLYTGVKKLLLYSQLMNKVKENEQMNEFQSKFHSNFDLYIIASRFNPLLTESILPEITPIQFDCSDKGVKMHMLQLLVSCDDELSYRSAMHLRCLYIGACISADTLSNAIVSKIACQEGDLYHDDGSVDLGWEAISNAAESAVVEMGKVKRGLEDWENRVSIWAQLSTLSYQLAQLYILLQPLSSFSTVGSLEEIIDACVVAVVSCKSHKFSLTSSVRVTSITANVLFQRLVHSFPLVLRPLLVLAVAAATIETSTIEIDAPLFHWHDIFKCTHSTTRVKDSASAIRKLESRAELPHLQFLMELARCLKDHTEELDMVLHDGSTPHTVLSMLHSDWMPQLSPLQRLFAACTLHFASNASVFDVFVQSQLGKTFLDASFDNLSIETNDLGVSQMQEAFDPITAINQQMPHRPILSFCEVQQYEFWQGVLGVECVKLSNTSVTDLASLFLSAASSGIWLVLFDWEQEPGLCMVEHLIMLVLSFGTKQLQLHESHIRKKALNVEGTQSLELGPSPRQKKLTDSSNVDESTLTTCSAYITAISTATDFSSFLPGELPSVPHSSFRLILASTKYYSCSWIGSVCSKIWIPLSRDEAKRANSWRSYLSLRIDSLAQSQVIKKFTKTQGQKVKRKKNYDSDEEKSQEGDQTEDGQSTRSHPLFSVDAGILFMSRLQTSQILSVLPWTSDDVLLCTKLCLEGFSKDAVLEIVVYPYLTNEEEATEVERLEWGESRMHEHNAEKVPTWWQLLYLASKVEEKCRICNETAEFENIRALCAESPSNEKHDSSIIVGESISRINSEKYEHSEDEGSQILKWFLEKTAREKSEHLECADFYLDSVRYSIIIIK